MLGKEKTIICRRGQARIATDLDGITYCNLDQKCEARVVLIKWLQSLHDKDN